jgi:CrcB protein
MHIREFLMVGLGGAIGSMMRYGTGLLLKSITIFPVGTLTVNLVGSFLIGIIAGIATNNPKFQEEWYLLLAVGICGGFTTFSALSLEGIQMIQQQKIMLYLLYASSSILLGLLFTFGGYKLIK